jgi:hypothetical protein
MPLIHLREDTRKVTFVTGALVSASIAIAAPFLKDEFDRINGKDVERLSLLLIVATVFSTFGAALLVNSLAYVIFGFGGGSLGLSEEDEKDEAFVREWRAAVAENRV